MKYILGLTGPTGSGKSTASEVARREGWYVINCDEVAKEATDQKKALKKLADTFGEEILNPDGTLNRAVLAEKAFSSKENTELLNKTVLPSVVELIKEKIEDTKNDKILLDAPTLYESGADSLCDAVCVILSREETRLVRIMERDNMDVASATLRMSAGKEDSYYKSKTRHILYNDKDEQTLKQEFSSLLNSLGGN